MNTRSIVWWNSLLAITLLLNFGRVYAQEGHENSIRPPEEKNASQKLVRVSTLNSVEANQEFQRNVQILQAQRQRAIELQYQLETAQSESLKKGLQEELDLALKTLEENNKKMTEAYGFSLTRDYVLVVEKAHIYMAVSEDEITEIEKQPEKDKNQSD